MNDIGNIYENKIKNNLNVIGYIKDKLFHASNISDISDIQWANRIQFNDRNEIVALLDSFHLDLKSKSDLIVNLESELLYIVLVKQKYYIVEHYSLLKVIENINNKVLLEKGGKLLRVLNPDVSLSS